LKTTFKREKNRVSQTATEKRPTENRSNNRGTNRKCKGGKGGATSKGRTKRHFHNPRIEEKGMTEGKRSQRKWVEERCTTAGETRNGFHPQKKMQRAGAEVIEGMGERIVKDSCKQGEKNGRVEKGIVTEKIKVTRKGSRQKK